MSTEPDTPLTSCRLDQTTYEETLVQLSAGPNFGESIINDTPWGEQPESMQLPSDVTLGRTLDVIDERNPNVENGSSRKSLYQYVLDLGQRPSCKFTEADRESLASGLINWIFPGGNLPDIMKHVEHVVGVEPADTLDPLHFQDDLPDINTNVLVRTVEGRVGYVRQWQDYCSQPTCADPLFRDGQVVVLTSIDNGLTPMQTRPNVWPLRSQRFRRVAKDVTSIGPGSFFQPFSPSRPYISL